MPVCAFPVMEPVSVGDIEQVLTLFSRAVFDVKFTEEASDVQNKCQELFEKDYNCCRVENVGGELSKNYPPYIIIPTEEKIDPQKDGSDINRSSCNGEIFNATKFKSLATKANYARCWTRCPVPVILCNGKFVCRSSTLACSGESKIRECSNYFTSLRGEVEKSDVEEKDDSDLMNGSQNAGLRLQDIKLLKDLSVGYICDLMVEMKKMKFLLPISSSEKIDKENRYSDFKIVQLPYPGCEFFKKFKDNNYVADNLFFDWKQNYVDSDLLIPSDSIVSHLRIHWSNYKTWDLVQLTQHYLKLLLTYISEGTSSILIHCISGWDRTPLFISLLRMSLWADGKAHCSLSPIEITYLTLAYDWYLFGHDLPARLKSGEEILFFCFHFLKYITSDKYSSLKRDRKISGNGSDCPLGVLIEDSSTKGSIGSLTSSGSSASFHSQDNCPPSSFTAHPDSARDNCSRSIFYANIDSGDESELKNCSTSEDLSSAMKCPLERRSSGHSSPSTTSNSLDSENAANNNGCNDLYVLAKESQSSSPVPVPSVRQRLDSSSSFGSWQIVTATGSMPGSGPDGSNLSEVNHNASRAKNVLFSEGDSSPCKRSRHEKLSSVRSLFHKAYEKVIDNPVGKSSLLAWLR